METLITKTEIVNEQEETWFSLASDDVEERPRPDPDDETTESKKEKEEGEVIKPGAL